MPTDTRIDAVVAGHICLDIIPTFESQGQMKIAPGQLLRMGPAVISTGGAVSNTGLGLHRLGLAIRLMGKVGDDIIGRAIGHFIETIDPALAEGMIVDPQADSSYTVVISPPGVDRTFLHCPGANDTFAADDVDSARLAGGRLFHFGYPPLMQRMYADGGKELAALMQRARQAGLTATLDMSLPDVNSPAGELNWPKLLERVLPHVDVYLPSIEETLLMLDRPAYLDMVQAGGGAVNIAGQVTGEMVSQAANRLLDMGAAVVVIKLGDQGAYLRTSDDADRLNDSGRAAPADIEAWRSRELIAPCFSVHVAGTTGSGDCTIAGFLNGWLRRFGPIESLRAGVAVGACNCEAADATSGVRPWDAVARRIADGWECRPVDMSLAGWRYEQAEQVYIGPADSHGR